MIVARRAALGATLAGILLAAAVPCGQASAGFFDRVLGKSTYQTFKGKFIDTNVVHEASATATGSAATKAIGGEGHFVGSATWDGIPSPELQAYGEKILNRLLASWGGEHPRMRLWITADPGLEAESNSAGDLFLARGWFDNVESEDEIAAVLAHEVSHVLLGHFGRDDEHERNRMAVVGAAGTAATAFTLASVRPEGSGTATTLAVGNQAKVNHQIRDAAMIKFAIDEVSNVALNAPWAREQEDQADLLGIDLLYRAKYNVLAMRDVLQRLADYEKAADKQTDLLSGDYRDSLSQSLVQGDTTSLTDTLKDAVWSAAGKVNDSLSRSHPDTKARLDDVAKYIGREYEDDAGPQPNAAAFKSFKAGKKVAEALSDHTEAAKASAMLDKKDRAKRASLAARAAKQGASNAPFPLRVMAQTLTENGNAAKALALYRRAADSPEASFATVTMLAGAYVNAGNFAKADSTLTDAVKKFGSAEAVYPMRITIDLKRGDQQGADATFKQCLGVKNEGLTQECKSAHGDSCSSLECRFSNGSKDVKETAPGIAR